MIPADGVIVAAARWLDLLGRSSEAQASLLIRSNSRYADLTPTQYASGLEWLRSLSWTKVITGAAVQPDRLLNLTPQAKRERLLASLLESAQPPWLENADVLVQNIDDLPQDVERWSELLGLPDSSAFRVVRMISGKIDLASRARIGNAGEIALCALLEAKWPGAINHVAKTNDGYGYDVSVSIRDVEWHLEVKSTTRKNRLSFYLSRHEFETGLPDEHWKLLVVGLDNELKAKCVAEVSKTDLKTLAPSDQAPSASWASTRYELGRRQLLPGMSFLPWDKADMETHKLLIQGAVNQTTGFSWMPSEVTDL
ncbi:protein NO VEIN domain-containing protein [Arthrobacter koreensis]|uniref:protein NO VEIN domain-containing protein n=1 Tax=Arthrobacter koreensis TaxID=199136 RepID=UPI0036D8BE51